MSRCPTRMKLLCVRAKRLGLRRHDATLKLYVGLCDAQRRGSTGTHMKKSGDSPLAPRSPFYNPGRDIRRLGQSPIFSQLLTVAALIGPGSDNLFSKQ